MFRVKNREKALRKIEEVRKAFGRDLDDSRSERYRNDEGLWDCSVQVPGCDGSAAEIAFDCLVLAARVATGWLILGPGVNGDLRVFEGVFNLGGSSRPHISGLEWASFELSFPCTVT